MRTFTVGIALALSLSVHAQEPGTDAFIAWARAQAIPLPACSTQSDTGAVRVVAPVIGSARVVALGEPAHGAHEPLAFRNCLFRYLVEHQGFTAIALETGLNESRRLWDYVAGGSGNARQLVRESLSWGFWRYRENVELIEWMHRYNADPAHQRKIRFYGIDMSGGERSGEWRNARIALDDSLSWLARVEPAQFQPVLAALDPFRDRFTLPGYLTLSAAERRELRSALRSLVDFFDLESSTLVAASDEQEFAWAKRNAVLASQLEALFRVSRPVGLADELAPDDYRAVEVRDKAMADNVSWVIEREGEGGRILLFAHNGHVMNAPGRGGIWSVYRRAPKSMGQHLRAARGDQVRIIATTAAANDPGISSEGQPPGTLDRALDQAVKPPVLLDFRSADKGAAATWLMLDQSIRTNFTTESVFVPSVAMDAIVFFERLSPHLGQPAESVRNLSVSSLVFAGIWLTPGTRLTPLRRR